MIKLSNGHEFDFACASGALAFDGDGYWWEQPARILGYLRPYEFTIIAKTVTMFPRIGNLKWWCPWRCVRIIPGGSVNAVGLTNGGIHWWINKCYPKILRKGYAVIASIAPENEKESEEMVRLLNQKCKNLVGIQINTSCPNVKSSDTKLPHNLKIVKAALSVGTHPLALKLGYTDPYREICQALDGELAFYELINTVPWSVVFPNNPSPLAPYGLEGGVSGLPILPFAREALANVMTRNTPIASGGGISAVKEVYARRVMGARGIVLGVSFLRNVGKPNEIIDECRRTWTESKNRNLFINTV